MGNLVGGFKYFTFSPLFGGRFPILLIFFKWAETTNQEMIENYHFHPFETGSLFKVPGQRRIFVTRDHLEFFGEKLEPKRSSGSLSTALIQQLGKFFNQRCIKGQKRHLIVNPLSEKRFFLLINRLSPANLPEKAEEQNSNLEEIKSTRETNPNIKLKL